MERNKVEKQFKEKLNSREIKPTDMAWDRLDAMLSVAENKKPNRKFNWVYIAASFIGFSLFGTLFFNQTETELENHKDKIANQQSISTNTHTEPSTNLNTIPDNKRIVNIQKNISKGNKKVVSKIDSLFNKENLNQNPVAEVSIINQKKESESNTTPTKTLTVDELLAKVDKSSRLTNTINPNLKIKVNPNQLLQQVDNDLEPTFRQNVFSKVATNLKAVKEAVANRNKE
ncbi:hypothetical protein C3L50_02595 [Flavobacterium alvei]|uniref:Uncharacterized protein n=1 Tax=Flavobacterium alvei TaxID=2080416 RepID=A0A2S5AFW5_9FLAO|nr:hypothetical protein [Flavobacterium alvei]POY41426.1 hypothetical protein C3L50_02595 [Flavobacterium alvei]